MKYKQDWYKAQQRYIAWWNCEIIDRIPIFITAPRKNSCNIESKLSTSDEELSIEGKWLNIDYVLKNARKNFEKTFYAGEAFPVYYPGLGPDIFAGFLGAGIKFAESTTWSIPFIEDWTYRKKFILDPENKWWKKIADMTEAAVKDSDGDYFIGITDLHPGVDALSAIRGGENLCFDMVDNPGPLKEALVELFDIWREVYDCLFNMINVKMQGSSAWLNVWSPGKWYPVSCDFICMISPAMFEEFVFPVICRETDYLDNSLFHLDGPGALKHLDRLLEIPKLGGIQWGPGEGQPSPAHWIPVLKKIQKAGKLIHIYIPPYELAKVLDEISPKGLFIETYTESEEEACELIKSVEHLSFKRKFF